MGWVPPGLPILLDTEIEVDWGRFSQSADEADRILRRANFEAATLILLLVILAVLVVEL